MSNALQPRDRAAPSIRPRGPTGRTNGINDPSQEYRLEAFEQFCREEGIENLNDLSGRDLYAYRVWRREGNGKGRDEIEPITLRGQQATLGRRRRC